MSKFTYEKVVQRLLNHHVLVANLNKNDEQFLQQIENSRTFLRAKQVGEKRGRLQFVVEIAHKAVVLILISL